MVAEKLSPVIMVISQRTGLDILVLDTFTGTRTGPSLNTRQRL